MIWAEVREHSSKFNMPVASFGCRLLPSAFKGASTTSFGNLFQGGCGCPISGGIQGQIGCGIGQPNLAGRGVGIGLSLRSFTTQAIL